MFVLKYILSVILAGSTALFPLHLQRAAGTNKALTKWSVEESSTLRVEGQSNVNKFRCDINGYAQADTIVCLEQPRAGEAIPLRGALKIDIFSFDCHSRLITNDLRKTLQAEHHPKLTIRFLSLERMPVFNGNTDLVKGWVHVELAGASKNVEILYSFVKTGSSIILLNGGKTFCFSDFNLKPPRRLAGMIQIRDEFEVNFRLTLAPV